jgi:hypothetical protein
MIDFIKANTVNSISELIEILGDLESRFDGAL